MKKLLLLLAVLLSGSAPLFAQDCTKVPPSDNKIYPWCYQTNVGTNWDTSPYKAFIINGMPFRLLYPKTYSSSSTTRYPLVILLHGIGEKGTDNNLQLRYGGKEHMDALNKGTYEGFIMAPQSPYDLWATPQRTALLSFIEVAIQQLRVDPFRVILEGFSGGGTAVWELANQYPQVFSGAIPMSAANSTIAGYAHTLRYTAVWHAQGGRDTQPSPSAGNSVASKFKAAGANYTYQYYPELGHGTWFEMYKEKDFFPFMMRSSQLRIHALFFKYNFCTGEVIGGTMGVKQGFEAYEWRRNGSTISGASGHELSFSAEGDYTVRIKRKGVWSAWSEPLTIQRVAPTPTPTIVATGPTALPSLDGRKQVTLRAPRGFQSYQWSNNTTLDSLVVKSAGSYSASVTQAFGCPSGYSAPIKVTYNSVGVLPAPTNLGVATISETELELSWSDKSSNESGFEIYRRISAEHPWQLIAQLSANKTSYLDKGLQPFTRYFYSIRSVNSDGGSTYASNSGKTRADALAPAAPANLEVTRTSPNSIGLSWTHATDNADGEGTLTYEIYTKNRSELLATTTKTSFVVKDLPERQQYNFAVRAVDQLGNKSEFSNQATGGTYYSGLFYTYYEGNLSSVYNISLLEPLKWGVTDGFDTKTHRLRSNYYAYSFEGYLNIPSSGSYTFYTTSDDGSTLTINGVEVVNNNGRHSRQEKSGSISLAAGWHEIKVLYFEYTGSDEVLEVRWQGPGISKQQIPASAFAESISLPKPPTAPSGLTATTLDHQRITLKWTDNSSNESGFEVLRSTSNSGPYRLVKLASANTSQYIDSGLQPNTTYYYKLRAINSSGESAYAGQISSSSWVNAKTATGSSSLPAPGSLTAFRSSSSSAQLNWTDGAYNETGYEIWRGTDGVNFSRLATIAANGTHFTDNAITSSSSFYYRLRAVHASGSSAWSNVAALSTQNKPPVLSGLPAVVSAPESSITEYSFTLSDPEGVALALTARYLPPFAKVERVSSTRGRLILTPTARDIGYYRGIQLTASDGLLETDVLFSISIKDHQKTSIYVNMGQSSVAEKPWNNTNTWGGVSNKVLLANLQDENGSATGYALTQLDPWSNSKPWGETTGTNSGIFPDEVSSSAYIVNPGATVRFKISGLKSSLRYNFVFFGSSIYKSNNGSTRYTIGSQSVQLPVQSNSDRTVQINGVKANSSGEVIISVTGASDASRGGYLNAFVVEEYPDNGLLLRPGRFQAQAVSQTEAELYWTDNSYQETGFEIWRRSLPSGSFSKIATTAANATSYTDKGLAANRGYEYRIRAANGSTYSAFSESRQVASLQYQVLINAEYGSSASDPWNNLKQRPTTGYTWYNFKTTDLQRSGINLKLEQTFDGSNNFGPDAQGQAIYPDKVVKSFYFNEIGSVAKMHFYGLNDALTYNFRFFASSAFGNDNGVSEYRIGDKKVTLDVQKNLRNTAVIRNVQPERGSVRIEVEAGDFARYGYLSALVIEARDGYRETAGANANARMEDAEEAFALDEAPVLDISVYPNPAQAELFVYYTAKAAGPRQLQVLDMTGRQVVLQEVEAQEGNNTFFLDLNAPSLSPGLYLLRLHAPDGAAETIRFVKQ
ncbi:fibronectin type III domain-containing protein [Cesiribacter andamanensis]|uniref:Exoglucanase B n=1 Tax=Cesiribacter andamanensis AMV16 TaxID=1279009 RepID=M7N289_9BACT|nr:fibronectin type III domain-containing protein [Cesiribacter andamanensis]EMR01427.1 Exoglucanase B precursor [Cesiribacter andamanensis AMV16]